MAHVQGVATMDNWTAGDYGGLAAGGLAVLAALGKGLAWLLNWQGAREDRKAKKLADWEASLTRREQENREELEGKFRVLEQRTGALAISLFDVTLELKQHDPQSPAIARAQAVLRAAFPVDQALPDGLTELLHRLDEMGGRDGH